jgi:hypothetical protein
MSSRIEAGFPLLHVAQTAARVYALDGRILAFAMLAFVVSAALIWWPMVRRHAARARSRRRIASAAMTAVVALALLPAVFPYDHLLPHADAAGDDSEVHVAHCHVSPGTCSDLPLASGPGQFLATEPLVVVPAMLALVLFVAVPSLTGISPSPELRPPVGSSAV